MCIDLQMLSAYMDGELKEPYLSPGEGTPGALCRLQESS